MYNTCNIVRYNHYPIGGWPVNIFLLPGYIALLSFAFVALFGVRFFIVQCIASYVATVVQALQ